MKIIFTSKRSIGMFALLVIGILFLSVPHKYLYPIVLCFIGSVICLDGIIKLTLLNRRTQGVKEFTFDFIEGMIDMLVGVMVFKFYEYWPITLGAGIIYAIIPILRILLSQHKLNQFVIDILKYLAIIVLITSFDKKIIMRIIVSSIFLGVAAIIFITLLIKIRKEKKRVALE